MPGYLQIDDTWVPVEGISVPQSVDYQLRVVIEETLKGRRQAQVAHRPAHRDWRVRLGLANATTLRLWERLVDGSYGIGPFYWVDPFAAAAAGPPELDGPPHTAVIRPVVITDLGRADRRVTNTQQVTAITVTLSTVGLGVASG